MIAHRDQTGLRRKPDASKTISPETLVVLRKFVAATGLARSAKVLESSQGTIGTVLAGMPVRAETLARIEAKLAEIGGAP